MIYDITRPYFTEKEAWGDPEKMSGLLLLVLLAIREIVNEPFYIYCGYSTTGHVDGSFHYKVPCLAVDFGTKSDIWNAYCDINTTIINLQLEKSIGLGAYPHWKPYPGFHLDIRGWLARWAKLKRSEYTKKDDDAEDYVSIETFVKIYGDDDKTWRTV